VQKLSHLSAMMRVIDTYDLKYICVIVEARCRYFFLDTAGSRRQAGFYSSRCLVDSKSFSASYGFKVIESLSLATDLVSDSRLRPSRCQVG
jgi:hypothetical protein